MACGCRQAAKNRPGAAGPGVAAAALQHGLVVVLSPAAGRFVWVVLRKNATGLLATLDTKRLQRNPRVRGRPDV